MAYPRRSEIRALEAPKRVLLVDEHVDSVEALTIILTRRGHDVRAAFDALEAFQAAIVFEPDVVVLDIGLPGTSGYELAEMFRGTAALGRCRFVALTGDAYEVHRRQSEMAGFYRHLTKPFDPESLFEAVESSDERASCAPPNGWSAA